MRKFRIVFGALTAAAAVTLGVSLIPKEKATAVEKPQINEAQHAVDLKLTRELLDAGKPEEALEIIYTYRGEIERLTGNGLEWLQLFITGAKNSRDIPQLAHLFEFFPETFKEHESASLLVADFYINNNQVKDYKKIRSLWEDRETKVAAWYLLDVDKLLLEGRRQEAIELLQARTYKNKADVGRLLKLALLLADEDPKAAWKHLGEAYSKDSQNTDIRSYRAKLLESAGKFNLAHREYQAATRLSPENVFVYDQLADFYLRQKQYPLALNALKSKLAPPSLDKVWVKALFWSKVTTPFHYEWDETPAPKGRLEPLIQHLVDLNSDQFWNEEKFDLLPNKKYYLRTQQETFWLKLLGALKNKNEKDTYKLLKYNPFMTSSWHPGLEKALKRVLTYRMNGTLDLEEPIITISDMIPENPTHQELPLIFQQLEKYSTATQDSNNTLPEELHNLLKSNEVFSVLFIAIDWYEAGLQLHQLPIIPENFPDWVAVNLTEAIHHNRSTLEALEFASLQPPTPQLSLLEAELLITGGNREAALEKLNDLAKLQKDIGYRAAWLASLLYIEKKDWTNAKNVIIAQNTLVNELLGRETLARIAHLEGDTVLADKLYTAIEKISPEARSYLAKKAFAEKNWQRARELTEKLISDYPNNPKLKKNLEKILEEEQRGAREKSRASIRDN